ncbi:anti-sigma factor [Alteromonas ponticola]|uniref:Anti-sigma factor n=1 Tax=Alteromonas ponticola TaxID=2720613 RepID=A0ABX1R2Q1_9ALTE|nr:anti-sigma factor [Alteromonas ponticola]NMH60053.1 anti-sigma factor [Alteromonas ponticola]
MNYVNDENLYKLLAAEYVLGTLVGKARARFQKLMMEYPQVTKAVWDWERYFSTMNAKLLPIEPPPALYKKIEAKLFAETGGDTDNIVPITPQPRQVKSSSSRLTIYSGLAAVVAVLIATFLIYQRPPVSPVEDKTVAIVQNSEAKSLWLIDIQDQGIVVTATANVTQYSDKDYELWMVPKQGDAPISLGVIPKSGKRSLTIVDGFDITNLAALAVSLEPLGGSPSGTPTEVLFTTDTVLLPTS